MQRKYDFTGGVAMVTGSATGIGHATAVAFAREGADLVLVDTQNELGKKTIQEIEELGRKAIFIQGDVSRDEDIKRVMAETIKVFGRLDCAFNNAGIEGEQASTADCTEKNWDRVINVNLKGVWLCMKYQIAQMLKQEGGSIVNCSSIAGLVGFQGVPAYVASKHGVVGLTKTAALEYAKLNIRINAVCPGVIQTPMIDRFTHGEVSARKQLEAAEPMGRVGSPEEIASAVLWLSSKSASFVTGHSLTVDGGWVAQ